MTTPSAPARVEGTLDPLVLLIAVHDYMEAAMIGPHPDAPGHSHNVPGKWDKDGTPCEWCATWNRVRKCVKQNAPRQPQRDSGIGLDAVVGENEPRAKCIHGAWIDEQNCPKCKIMMAELIHREPKNPRKG